MTMNKQNIFIKAGKNKKGWAAIKGKDSEQKIWKDILFPVFSSAGWSHLTFNQSGKRLNVHEVTKNNAVKLFSIRRNTSISPNTEDLSCNVNKHVVVVFSKHIILNISQNSLKLLQLQTRSVSFSCASANVLQLHCVIS